jgi:hypothetical protein
MVIFSQPLWSILVRIKFLRLFLFLLNALSFALLVALIELMLDLGPDFSQYEVGDDDKVYQDHEATHEEHAVCYAFPLLDRVGVVIQ